MPNFDTLTTSQNRTLLESQIKPGLVINPLTIENFQLFSGVHRSLIDQETGERKGVNGYAVVTNFFLNGLWSEHPISDADRRLLMALESSTVFRSMNGYGVVIKQGNRYQAIDSRYFWYLVDDNGDQIGSVVMYPYSSTNEEFPNRARVVISNNANRSMEVREYVFQGVTLGRVIGTNTVAGDVIAWGDGANDYDNIRYLINELNKRLDKNSILLDRHSSPHLMGPPNAFQKRDPKGTSGQESDNSQFKYNEEGMYLPVDSQGVDYKYLTWESEAELNKFQVSTVLNLIHIETGIPATAFGISSATGDSGLSLERQMFAALAKVRRWQRDIEDAIEHIGIDDLQWPRDPFGSYSEKVNQVIQLISAGLITPDEGRKLLGIKGPAPIITTEDSDNDSNNTQNVGNTS